MPYIRNIPVNRFKLSPMDAIKLSPGGQVSFRMLKTSVVSINHTLQPHPKFKVSSMKIKSGQVEFVSVLVTRRNSSRMKIGLPALESSLQTWI